MDDVLVVLSGLHLVIPNKEKIEIKHFKITMESANLMLSRMHYMYIESIMLAECISELHHKYLNSTAGLTV